MEVEEKKKQQQPEQQQEQQLQQSQQQQPTDSTCLLVIGMAGSGKTTFLKELYNQISQNSNYKSPGYLINLDPAVQFLPYTPYLDIRNYIDYKKVMKEHGLGPNGAIITSLNLFSAQFQVVLKEIEENQSTTELFIVDTPGQIEVFTWSASGNIISQTIAATLPTALVYIIDAVRCQNPNVFMSNMLFCCSIFYKMKLPMIVVLNKSDKANTEKLVKWMKDYEEFLKDIEKDDNYLSTLSRSMCLSLDEFYENLNVVSLSSLTGDGFQQFFQSINLARKEYNEIFLPDLLINKQKFDEIEKQKINQELMKFTKSINDLKINNDNQNQNISQEFFKGKKVQFSIPEGCFLYYFFSFSKEEDENEQDKKH